MKFLPSNIGFFFALLQDEAACIGLFRKIRWENGVACPDCTPDRIRKNKRYGKFQGGDYGTLMPPWIKKNGWHGEFQRYMCYVCGHGFSDKTGTPLHYSRVPVRGWFTHVWLSCIVSKSCVSTLEISRKLGVAYKTAYRMTRLVLGKVADVQKGLRLKGECEADELYVHAGMKGRGYSDKIMESCRLPSRRGLKHGKGRGGFWKDFPMVMCFHQRGGPTIYTVPQDDETMVERVAKVVDAGSKIFTDELSAYTKLPEAGYTHDVVKHKDREYARGEVHTNNCECRAGLLRDWLGKYRGVNKYHLELYANMFQFLHNRRSMSDEDKFVEVIRAVCA